MAGPINPLTLTVTHLYSWSAPTTNALLGAIPGANAFTLSELFQNPQGQAPFAADQLIVQEIQIANSGNATLNLAAAMSNVVANAAATIGHVKCAAIWLPSLAQNANLGSNASSITIGNAAGNQALLFGLAANGTVTLNLGEEISWLTPGAGYAITSGTKSLLINNNDTTNNANVILILGGTSA